MESNTQSSTNPFAASDIQEQSQFRDVPVQDFSSSSQQLNQDLPISSQINQDLPLTQDFSSRPVQQEFSTPLINQDIPISQDFSSQPVQQDFSSSQINQDLPIDQTQPHSSVAHNFSTQPLQDLPATHHLPAPYASFIPLDQPVVSEADTTTADNIAPTASFIPLDQQQQPISHSTPLGQGNTLITNEQQQPISHNPLITNQQQHQQSLGVIPAAAYSSDTLANPPITEPATFETNPPGKFAFERKWDEKKLELANDPDLQQAQVERQQQLQQESVSTSQDNEEEGEEDSQEGTDQPEGGKKKRSFGKKIKDTFHMMKEKMTG